MVPSIAQNSPSSELAGVNPNSRQSALLSYVNDHNSRRFPGFEDVYFTHFKKLITATHTSVECRQLYKQAKIWYATRNSLPSWLTTTIDVDKDLKEGIERTRAFYNKENRKYAETRAEIAAEKKRALVAAEKRHLETIREYENALPNDVRVVMRAMHLDLGKLADEDEDAFFLL